MLLEVRESKRAVILRTDGRQEAIRKAAKSVDPRIHVVFSDLSEEPIASNSLPYILQKYSPEWNEFLDVTDVDMIMNRDRLRLIPRSPSVAQTLTHNWPTSNATVSPCSSHTSGLTSAGSLTDTATSICQSVGNVSGSVTQKMKSLFPSTSFSGAVRCPVSVFDPTKECAVAVNQKKKKKAVRIKPINLTVMAITGYRVHKNKVLREGRQQKVQINRVMTAQEVKQAIVSSYPQHLGIDNYEVLESERGGRLSLAKEQFPDGASLVEGICKRKAMLYIRPKHSEGESDEELPSAASILGKRTPEAVIDLSDDDVETSADQLKSVFPVIHPISFYSSQSSGLEESRRIREE